MTISRSEFEFLKTSLPKPLILLNIALIFVYLYVIGFVLEVSNVYLFAALMVGQIFYTWLGLAHLYTIWDMNKLPKPRRSVEVYAPRVDVYITVAGEPIDIIEETARKAKTMMYPNHIVYFLNDGYVANKENWRDVEVLAERLGVGCITRTVGGGAKAGNINNALEHTSGEIVVILDADHVPHGDFLQKMIPHFKDETVGFVQAPQYYKNYAENPTTGGAWDQQMLFYGTICKGRNNYSSVTMCGTNLAIRRAVLLEVGGMCTENIAEDFITGMYIHERGYRSVYVPHILAEGLAPEDFLSYYKQQLRWARGSLEVFFKANPLFRPGLTWPQRIQYLASSSYYLIGIFVLTNGILPLLYLFFGLSVYTSSTMVLAAAFLPYIFVTLYGLQRSSSFTYTYRALAFTMSSFTIYLQAIIATLSGAKQNFAITSKRKLEGTFLTLVIPHLVYIVLTVMGVMYALSREGITPSLMTNAAWALLNASVFAVFVHAALWKKQEERAGVMNPRFTSRSERHSRAGVISMEPYTLTTTRYE
jgi:cellulose synthase (UDP-forming)